MKHKLIRMMRNHGPDRSGHPFGKFGRPGGGRGGRGGGSPDGADRGGPMGRRRRQFDGEALRLLTLHLIGEGASHGYELIRGLDERTKGGYVPSPGMIYPLLTLLTETGLIADDGSDGARRSYRLTDDGRAELTAKADILTLALARLDHMAQRAERVDPAPVRRAMGNLKAALMARLGDGEVTQEVLNAIVDTLDTAARDIERMQ